MRKEKRGIRNKKAKWERKRRKRSGAFKPFSTLSAKTTGNSESNRKETKRDFKSQKRKEIENSAS